MLQSYLTELHWYLMAGQAATQYITIFALYSAETYIGYKTVPLSFDRLEYEDDLGADSILEYISFTL